MTNTAKPKQRAMDEVLEDTFPASDPPSWSTPQNHPERELKKKKEESRGRPDKVENGFFRKEDYLSSND